MSKSIWPPQCNFCSKLMSYKDMDVGFSWTPFGNANDFEEPEEEWAHAACWEKAEDSWKDLIKRVSWALPHKHQVKNENT